MQRSGSTSNTVAIRRAHCRRRSRCKGVRASTRRGRAFPCKGMRPSRGTWNSLLSMRLTTPALTSACRCGCHRHHHPGHRVPIREPRAVQLPHRLPRATRQGPETDEAFTAHESALKAVPNHAPTLQASARLGVWERGTNFTESLPQSSPPQMRIRAASDAARLPSLPCRPIPSTKSHEG